jgi:RNA polymerase sigma-70 factor (ECF subfamily)
LDDRSRQENVTDTRFSLAGRGFEADRTHLRSVAYRMLGLLSEAEDAGQEAWLRLSRSGLGEAENLGGWMRTVVARVCLDMLRSRREAFADHAPEPAIAGQATIDPEQEAVLGASVGLALLVVLANVLDMLAKGERRPSS